MNKNQVLKFKYIKMLEEFDQLASDKQKRKLFSFFIYNIYWARC